MSTMTHPQMSNHSGAKAPSPPVRSTDQRGVGLIELMVALVVLTVGILAVSQLFPAGARNQQKGRMVTTANLLAQEKIESLLAAGFDHSDLTNGTHGPIAVGNGGRDSLTYLVATLPAPMDQVKRVDMAVSYTYLKARSDTLTAYIRK